MLEYHKRYADCHLLLAGNECIRYGIGNQAEVVPFEQEADIGFVTCDRTYDLDLVDDSFAYFFLMSLINPIILTKQGKQLQNA